MARLPSVRYADSIRTVSFDKFGGYVHRDSAGDGIIYDEKNMWGGSYPAASSRPPKKLLELYPDGYTGAVPDFFDFHAWDGVFYLIAYDSTEGRCGLYRYAPPTAASPVLIGTWPMSSSVEPRCWAAMGDRLVIFPDAVVYDRNAGTLLEIAVSCSVGNAVFTDGTYAGISAKANTVKVSASLVGELRAGDAVTISGCVDHAANNTTLIIREKEVSGSYAYLRFYENSFDLGSSASYTESGDVVIARTLPADAPIGYICECGGRIWGGGGNYIFACRQNDPFNWNVFDGLEGDSFAISCPGAGEITGCISYLGYPVFFKETGIYKILGDTADEFTVSETQCMGIKKGCPFSAAVAGGALFYNSKSGIMRYTGSMPRAMYYDFGRDKYTYAVAGSDGIRYYVKLTDSESGVDGQVFMFDTELSMWFRNDTPSYQTFSYDGTLWAMDNYRNIYALGEAGELPARMSTEGAVSSEIVFTDFTGSYYGRKGISKLHARVELDAGTEFKVYIRYDSVSDAVGGWELVSTVSAEGAEKKTYTVPIIPRRCDHFTLRLSAVGGWKLYQLTYEAYRSSALH